jgi:hypothetical protein
MEGKLTYLRVLLHRITRSSADYLENPDVVFEKMTEGRTLK